MQFHIKMVQRIGVVFLPLRLFFSLLIFSSKITYFININISVWKIRIQCVFKNTVPCSPETITTLLIGYTPMQNVFGVKKKLKN